MSAPPFRFEPVRVDPLWQGVLLVLSVAALVRLLGLWRPMRRRTWRAGGVLMLAALLLLARVVGASRPGAWRALFVLVVGGVGFALGLLAYRCSTFPVSRRRQGRLVALRGAALLAVLLALFRPALVRRTVTREKPLLLVLYDTSRSMGIRDAPGGLTRFEELLALRKVYGGALDRLRRRFEVVEYGMSGGLSGPGVPEGPPGGRATALGPALREAVRRSEGRPGAAVVLFTDGAHNTGIEPDHVVPLLDQRKIPVYAVGIGRDVAAGQVRDLALRAVRVNPTGFAGNLLPVSAELAALGSKGEHVRLQLLLDGRAVAEQEVAIAGEEETRRVELAFVPEEAGLHKVTVRAAVLPGEILAENNHASTYVNVLPGGLSILYVEGKVRWEYKFLRRTLEAGPDFQVTPVLLLAPLGGGREATPSRAPFQWERYDCVIIGDARPGLFTREELEGLKQAVGEGGKGLMMLAGYDAFGPGGWGDTPLADVLPVRMTPADPQLAGRFRMKPAPRTERHFLLQLEDTPRASRAAWERLPPLEGASTFAGLKPGAVVLATGERGTPLLVAQEYGRGRAIAFGADSTWRWAFSESDTLKYHKRFWRQVVLWLTRRDKAQGETMWLDLGRRRLRVGRDLEMTAHLQDARGRAMGGCEVSAVVRGPGGKAERVRFAQAGDVYRLTFRPKRAGDYVVEARALRGGREVGSARAKFIAFSPDLEYEQPLAELDRLRSLAARTGGAFFTPRKARFLFEALGKHPAPESVTVHTRVIPLWDRWWLFLFFLSALAAEWVLRKRWGLV